MAAFVGARLAAPPCAQNGCHRNTAPRDSAEAPTTQPCGAQLHCDVLVARKKTERQSGAGARKEGMQKKEGGEKYGLYMVSRRDDDKGTSGGTASVSIAPLRRGCRRPLRPIRRRCGRPPSGAWSLTSASCQAVGMPDTEGRATTLVWNHAGPRTQALSRREAPRQNHIEMRRRRMKSVAAAREYALAHRLAKAHTLRRSSSTALQLTLLPLEVLPDAHDEQHDRQRVSKDLPLGLLNHVGPVPKGPRQDCGQFADVDNARARASSQSNRPGATSLINDLYLRHEIPRHPYIDSHRPRPNSARPPLPGQGQAELAIELRLVSAILHDNEHHHIAPHPLQGREASPPPHVAAGWPSGALARSRRPPASPPAPPLAHRPQGPPRRSSIPKGSELVCVIRDSRRGRSRADPAQFGHIGSRSWSRSEPQAQQFELVFQRNWAGHRLSTQAISCGEPPKQIP